MTPILQEKQLLEIHHERLSLPLCVCVLLQCLASNTARLKTNLSELYGHEFTSAVV